MADYWHLWLGALFLRREAYEYQRERKDSFAHGLLFIVLIGVIVALSGIAGAALRYATSPNVDAVKNTILNHLQSMPFYAESIQPFPDAQRQFQSGYDQTWAVAGSLFMGYPISAADWARVLASVITTPISWIVGWLVYGVLAHLIASRGNPHANLSHGLGTLALATSPQALGVVNIIPQAGVNGLALALWTLILNVYALRTAYQVSTRRAVWAALFPLLLLLLLVLLCLILIVVLLRSNIPGGQ